MDLENSSLSMYSLVFKRSTF